LRWSLCPYCGAEQSEKAAIERERVAAPAARWTQSRPRRRATPVIVSRPTAPALGERTSPVIASIQPEDGSPDALGAPALNGREASEAAPVRLFDRRKTRAAQRGNGHGSDNGNGAWPEAARRSQRMNGAPAENERTAPVNGNGRAVTTDDPAAHSLAALFARDGRASGEREAPDERIPARLLTEKD
jgi:hypothetical protein